jgi:phosphatidylserine/phosphatidylglycerophosphate/cardiolipin synthase-like enzyme
LRDALLEAAQRGVEIHILTNSATTAQEVGFSGGYVLSLTYMEPLLEAGMRIYEVNGPQEEGMPKPYLHAKEFIIDGLWAAIGSFNLSIRSCYIESENLLNIQDEVFAQAQEENFWDRVRKDTTEITKEYLALQKERFRAKMAIARYLDLFY